MPPAGDRSLVRLVGRAALRNLPGALADLVLEFQRTLAAPLLPRWDHGFPPARAATGASWRRIRLTAAQSAALGAAARAAGGRVNDALVAAAIRVAAERTGGRAGAAYTVDLRRYAAAPVFSVANLSGVNMVTLSPAQLASPQAALEGVVLITGGQKSRTPGLAFTLLPLIFVGWLTHGMLHSFGRAFPRPDRSPGAAARVDHERGSGRQVRGRAGRPAHRRVGGGSVHAGLSGPRGRGDGVRRADLGGGGDGRGSGRSRGRSAGRVVEQRAGVDRFVIREP